MSIPGNRIYIIVNDNQAFKFYIDKLEVNFRRDERVLRFLTFRQDKFAAEYAEKRRNLKSSKKED